jgi:hypothetical protein
MALVLELEIQRDSHKEMEEGCPARLVEALKSMM